MLKAFSRYVFIFLCLFKTSVVLAQQYQHNDISIDVQFQVDGIPKTLVLDTNFIGFSRPLPLVMNDVLQSVINSGDYRDVALFEERLNENSIRWVITASSQKKNRTVEIEGVPLGSELEYSRTLRTKAGESFNPLDAELDVARLRQRLNERGYLKAEVTARVIEESNADAEVNVIFEVERGRPCRVSGLLIEPGIAILSFVTSPVEPGSLCDMPAIRESLERQKASLASEGYLATEFALLGIDYSPDKERGIVRLRMERGPRTRIEIYNIATNTREDALSERDGISVSDLAIMSEDDLREEIVKQFQRRGYARATITGPEKVVDRSGDVLIRFQIQPGPQMFVQEFIFKEPPPVPVEEVIKRFDVNRELFSRKIVFNELELARYQERLRDVYLENGYVDAEVGIPFVSYAQKENFVNLTFSVEPGKKHMIAAVTLVGMPLEIKTEPELLATSVLPGKPLVRELLQDLIQELRIAHLQVGYAYADAKVEISKVTETQTQISNDVKIVVNSGPLVRIRRIFAEGELFGKEKAIIRETSLHPGDLYTPENLDRARERLLKHGLFGSVEVTPADPSALERREHQIDLVVRTKSRGSYSLGLVPAWSSYSGYRFTVEFGKNNLTTDGLRLFSSATLSQENQQKTYADRGQLLGRSVNLGLVEPLFRMGSLVTPLDVSLSGSFGAEVQSLYNREFKTAVQETQWRPYFLGNSWSFSLKFAHESSSFVTSGLPLIQTLDQSSLRINEVGTTAALDTRDNREWATRGGLFELTYAMSRFGLTSEVQYDRYVADTNVYYPIWRRFSGAISLGGSQISNVVNSERQTVTAPGSRRRTLTGHTQVRGFPERDAPLGPLIWLDLAGTDGVRTNACRQTLSAIGATNVLYLKHEVRYRSPLWSNSLGFAWFVDTGSAYFTELEAEKIQQQLSQFSTERVSEKNECQVRSARLVGNDAIDKGETKAVSDYFSTSYVSSGLGARLIIPHFASVNFDWGFPLRDPADKKDGCIPIGDAVDSQTSPECVNRRVGAKFLKYFPGAFHVSIGAAF